MRGVQLGKVLLIAAAIEIVGLAGNAVTSLLTDAASGALRWILPQVVAVGAAMAKAVLDAAAKEPAPAQPGPYPPAPYPPGTYQPGVYQSGAHQPGVYQSGAHQPGGYPATQPAPYQPTPSQPVARRARRRLTPALIAIVVLLAVCGGGGFAIASGVRYVVGLATGHEAGTDRLVRPVAARAGDLTLTVRHVVYTSHYTRVDVLAQNDGDAAVTLPIFGNCVFVGADGTVLQGDPQRSDWSETIAPGVSQAGTIVFGGTLPDDVRAAALNFSQVFVLGGRSLTVRDIALSAG